MLEIIAPTGGRLSTGADEATDEGLTLDEVLRPAEGEAGIVGPAGGRLSMEEAVGPADAKLPGLSVSS
jgi:hypothetical protein